MKRNFYFLLAIFFILIFPNVTNAAQVKVEDIEMECVYDNGVVITAYYDGSNYGMSSNDMKLSNALTPPYNTALTYFYNEAKFSERILKDMTCPSSIGFFVVKQTDDSDNSVTFQVYYHTDDSSYLSNSNDEYDEAFFKSQIVPGFTPKSGVKVTFEIQKESALYSRISIYEEGNKSKARAFTFMLVAERIYFNNDVEPERQWAFKSEGTQAASNPTYIRVYEYKNPNGNLKKIVEKGNTFTTTTVSGTLNTHDDSKTIFACFKPSVKEIDSDKTDMAYKFSGVRHELSIKKTLENASVVEGTNGVSCSTGYSLYREVNWSEVPEDGADATSICDVIPETSLLIAKIINYARILVPIFLIILTAVDITKIILTGNVDEELPKRRKLIIIRFVVAVVFFFLPIFIQIFVSSSYGVDFGDISCLW